MYAMICCRPDLTHGMSCVSRFMDNPGIAHWEAVKWMLRYISGTLDYSLVYGNQVTNLDPLIGHVDSDYAANIDTRKSLTGYVFTLFGTTICWRSTHQSVVALSTTESEFMAMTDAVKEAIWLKGILSQLGLKQDKLKIYCDSQSAMHLSKHHFYHDRSNHIDIKYHFVRYVIDRGDKDILKIRT